MTGKKEWMLGLPGHLDLVTLEDVVRLISGGQLRETDLVKKLGEPWHAAGEIPELMAHFRPGARPKEPPRPPPPPPPKTGPMRKETSALPKAEPPARPAPKAEPPRKGTAPVPKAEPATARAPVPKTGPVPRKTTSSVPRAAAPAKPPEKPSEEETPPAVKKPSPAEEETPPAVEKPDTSGEETPAAPVKAAPEPPKEEPPKEKPRKPPKPPRVVPRMEPMAPKYFSPVDLLRAASHSFDPKKLFVTAIVLLPLLVFWSLLDHYHKQAEANWLRMGLFLVSTGSVVFGLAVAWTALAYVTRRQLEGAAYTVSDVVVYAVRNLVTALVYPVLVLVPSLLATAALWVLGLVRDMGAGAAAALKILYFVPMFFALVAVGGVLLYQLASMYIPAAGAIEGEGLAGATRVAWGNIRHQRGRVVLHWLIVTVAVGVITLVCLGLMILAVRMPDWIFGVPRSPQALKAYLKWQEFQGFFAVYRGLAYGLGLTLPVSLLSTLGALSYMALRHPVSAPLPLPPEETSGIDFESRRGGPTPMEATHPADANSPAGETRPGPDAPADDVSDDREDQPLA